VPLIASSKRADARLRRSQAEILQAVKDLAGR